jgi:hypothetical protein
MSVGDGTRPGSKPDSKIPGWDYMLLDSPGWEAIRNDPREVMRWEGEIRTSTNRVEKALISLKIAFIMLHGGHVEKGALAQSGLRKDMEPAAVIAHIQSLLPTGIPALK